MIIICTRENVNDPNFEQDYRDLLFREAKKLKIKDETVMIGFEKYSENFDTVVTLVDETPNNSNTYSSTIGGSKAEEIAAKFANSYGKKRALLEEVFILSDNPEFHINLEEKLKEKGFNNVTLYSRNENINELNEDYRKNLRLKGTITNNTSLSRYGNVEKTNHVQPIKSNEDERTTLEVLYNLLIKNNIFARLWNTCILPSYEPKVHQKEFDNIVARFNSGVKGSDVNIDLFQLHEKIKKQMIPKIEEYLQKHEHDNSEVNAHKKEVLRAIKAYIENPEATVIVKTTGDYDKKTTTHNGWEAVEKVAAEFHLWNQGGVSETRKISAEANDIMARFKEVHDKINPSDVNSTPKL